MSAVITGGSRGLGLAIAHRFASRNINVHLVARNERLLLQAVAAIPGSQYQCMDVTTDIADLSSAIYLINCAGITSHRLAASVSDEELNQVLQVNLAAPIRWSKSAIRPLIRNGKKLGVSPAIINISSVLADPHHTTPGTSVYAASKAGLSQYSLSLANELKGKVRVNCVQPGLLDTDMGRGANIGGKLLPVDVVAQRVVDLAMSTENGVVETITSE